MTDITTVSWRAVTAPRAPGIPRSVADKVVVSGAMCVLVMVALLVASGRLVTAREVAITAMRAHFARTVWAIRRVRPQSTKTLVRPRAAGGGDPVWRTPRLQASWLCGSPSR